jgi:hypothetical protein
VAGDRQKIDAQLIDASWNLANGLGSVGVKRDAVLMGTSGASLDGWMVPTSLLACMMLIRIVRGVIALRRSLGATRPVPSTGR